jgi:tetratricopeptide (TPR) repeat protein
MGGFDLVFSNDLISAKKNVDLALEMNSNFKVPTDYCMCLAVAAYLALEEWERAGELISLSKKIDPLNSIVFVDEGVLNMIKGNRDQSIYSFNQAVDFADTEYSNYWLGRVHYEYGDYTKALTYFEKGETNDLGQPWPLSEAFLSSTHLKLGDLKESEKYKKILLDRQSEGVKHLNIPLAMIAAAGNNTEETIVYLKRAIKENDIWYSYYLAVDPLFNELRNNEEIVQLISSQTQNY